jgi:hypothetical protein
MFNSIYLVRTKAPLTAIMKIFIYSLFFLTLVSCEEVNKLIDSSQDGPTTTYSFGAPKQQVHVVKPKATSKFKLLPQDESVNNPYLLVFIESLKKAVAKKDTHALFALFDPNITVSHGGGERGIEAFVKAYKLDQTGTSPLWKMLHRQLHLWGVTENEGDRYYFCIPYTQSNKAYAQFDYDFDWYHTAVCTVKESQIWSAPNEKSEKVALLSYDIVEMDPDFSPNHFTKIQSLDGSFKGFVKTADLAFTAEPHLEIVEIESEYKVVAYAPYD